MTQWVILITCSFPCFMVKAYKTLSPRFGNCPGKYEVWVSAGKTAIQDPSLDDSNDTLTGFNRNSNGFKKFYITLEDEVSFLMSKDRVAENLRRAGELCKSFCVNLSFSITTQLFIQGLRVRVCEWTQKRANSAVARSHIRTRPTAGHCTPRLTPHGTILRYLTNTIKAMSYGSCCGW